MNVTVDFETRFKEGMEDISHFSSGSAIRSCRQCVQSEYDAEAFQGEDTRQIEPYFSWSPCEICGSTLGGDREACHGIYNGSMIHIVACADCVYFAEYGTLEQ